MGNKKKPADCWVSERDYLLPKELREAFYEKIMNLAEEMFGGTKDGECPIEVEILDRTRFQPLHYLPVPYHHKSNRKERMRALLFNLQNATREIQTQMQLDEIHNENNL